MKPKWQKLAILAQEICTLQFQFFGAVFASKGYPFKNIFKVCPILQQGISDSDNCNITCELKWWLCKNI